VQWVGISKQSKIADRADLPEGRTHEGVCRKGARLCKGHFPILIKKTACFGGNVRTRTTLTTAGFETCWFVNSYRVWSFPFTSKSRLSTTTLTRSGDLGCISKGHDTKWGLESSFFSLVNWPLLPRRENRFEPFYILGVIPAITNFVWIVNQH
jgi:hypothetical protein